MDHECVVVGAGPHGLSAAVHLRRAGVDAHVFGRTMAFWESMPEGMKLRSNMSATNMIEVAGPLCLARFMAASGEQIEPPVPRERFIEYGHWVAQTGVGEIDERELFRLDWAAGAFTLELDDGSSLRANRVVIACGIAPFAHTPSKFAGLPGELASHTSEHRAYDTFAGQDVIVIGGGQSALEAAALLAEGGAARVEVLVRSRRVIWLRGRSVKGRLGPLGHIVYAPTDVGPLWYSRLVAVPDVFRRLPRRDQERIAARSIRPACSHFARVRLGPVRLTTGVHVASAEPRGDRVELFLADGTRRLADHLLFGTGYRVDVARYAFLGETIRRRLRTSHGYPILARGLESSVPGLHIVGAPAASSFGPIMRFISGSWYAARAVAQAAMR